MVKIAYILLCHKDPGAVIEQARRLTAAGDCVAIHFDARAGHAPLARIKTALHGKPGVTFADRRIKCGWGEWSLVEASLHTVKAALAAFPDATHFYLLSGDCAPIKSAAYAHAFLAERDTDFIESFDFFESDWIKTGIKEDRLIYRHVFNERSQKTLFYASLRIQRRLGLQRGVPADVEVMIGSQWWCLRRKTVEAILAFCRARRDVVRFFRTTWIPDETFFQTLVRHLVPEREIDTRTLTFLMFSDYGMPVTFYNDHYDLLLAQDFLFARKISDEATALKERLGALYAAKDLTFHIANEGQSLYGFLTHRGREGRRFAPRFWETDGTLGRDRELLIVLCKKWHVAKRLVARIREVTGLPVMEYLFDEESCALPDLGGIQSSMAKRHRHRRALMRMLFDHHGSERLVICLDPANIDLLKDFHDDRSATRTLEVTCRFSDSYLEGHARRIGLAGPATSGQVVERLMPTLRNDIAHESDRIRDARLPHHHVLREAGTEDENFSAISAFLSAPSDVARAVADTDALFAD